MKTPRALLGAVVAVALGYTAASASCVRATMPESTPCVSSALAQPFRGPLPLTQMVNYGCVGPWAFVWATLGTGLRAVGVTEVLYFDHSSATWRFASRSAVCGNGTLPARIDALGCHSN